MDFKKLLRNQWITLLVIALVSFSISYYLYGENLNAQWWFADDHEIMTYLGNSGHLTFFDIPEKLITATEIGQFGEYPRYRPSYYFLRLLETSIWGNNPAMFYFTRIMICAFFIVTCWFLSKSIIGWIPGFFFTLAIISFNYWSDIFSRLGPSECYAILGLSLYSFGIYAFIKKINSKVTWFIIFTGAIISIGSKENMVLLVIPTLLMFCIDWSKKRLSISAIIATVCVIFMIAVVFLSIFLSTYGKNSARGAYNNDISVSSLAGILINELRTFPLSISNYFSPTSSKIILTYFFVLFCLQFLLFYKTRKYNKRILIECSIWLISIYLLFLTQKIFYAQKWPTGMRYDFPGKLGEMIIILVFMFAIYKLFQELKIRTYSLVLFKSISCLLFILIFIENGAFQYIRWNTQNNVQRTVVFSKHIEKISQEISFHPDFPIIFESYNASDYEPLYSVNAFLRANQVTNPISINLNGYSSETYPEYSLENILAKSLQEISTKGSKSLFAEYKNIATYQEKCFTIDFSGYSESKCINLGRIY